MGFEKHLLIPWYRGKVIVCVSFRAVSLGQLLRAWLYGDKREVTSDSSRKKSPWRAGFFWFIGQLSLPRTLGQQETEEREAKNTGTSFDLLCDLRLSLSHFPASIWTSGFLFVKWGCWVRWYPKCLAELADPIMWNQLNIHFEKNNPVRVPVTWYFWTYVIITWACLFYTSLVYTFIIFECMSYFNKNVYNKNSIKIIKDIVLF